MRLPSNARSAAAQLAYILFARPLPRKLGLYGHDIPRGTWALVQTLVSELRDRGYEFVTASGFVSRFGSDDKLVWLSFDDSYSSWRLSLPLLESLAVPVTFFVNTLPVAGATDSRLQYRRNLGYDGPDRPLLSHELLALREAGHEVGGHGHLHLDLGSMARSEAEADVAVNKELLEEILGEQVRHFAWPFGLRRHFSSDIARYCFRIGYESISSATAGMQFASSPPILHRSPLLLERPPSVALRNASVDARTIVRLTGRSPGLA